MTETTEAVKIVLQSDITATLAQLGRFDLVTLLLTIFIATFTIPIPAVGLFTFLNIRKSAREEAKQTAEEI